MRVFVSRRDRNSVLRWLAVLGLGLAAGYVLIQQYAPVLLDPAALRAWIEGFGVWAPVAFIALQALQVVVAPIPGQVTVLLGGYLFGAVYGTVYSLVGATIGSAVVFWLSRRYGRRYVERVVTPVALARFDGLTRENALVGIFVGFLVPGIPDDVLCFVGGLTEVPLWKLLSAAAVGRLPSFVVVSVIGVELAERNLATAFLLAAIFAILVVVSYRKRGWLVRRVGG